MLNADIKTVQRSQDRLANLGWIATTRRRGKSNATSIRFENVPCEEIVRSKLTDEAKHLAGRYQNALKQNFGRKKFSKGWLGQQAITAQRILDECDGDVDLAAALISHALSHPQHTNRARKSLYNLFSRWPKILATYSAKLAAQEQAQQPKQTEMQ